MQACCSFAGQGLAGAGRRAAVLAPTSTPSRGALLVQNAHKKGAGSTKNGRDSNSKSRGVKVYGGQPVKAGGIIVRQLGSTVGGGGSVHGARGVAHAGGGGAGGRRGLDEAGGGGRAVAGRWAGRHACGSALPPPAHCLLPRQQQQRTQPLPLATATATAARSPPRLPLPAQWHSGTNTGLGKDYTLYSLTDGIVVYDKKKERPAVSGWEGARLVVARHCARAPRMQADPAARPLPPAPAPPQVHVYPLESEKAQAAVTATDAKQPKEGVKSRRERRLEAYANVPRKDKAAQKAATIAVATVRASMKP